MTSKMGTPRNEAAKPFDYTTDAELFRRNSAGAVASRLRTAVLCPPPKRSVLRSRICRRNFLSAPISMS